MGPTLELVFKFFTRPGLLMLREPEQRQVYIRVIFNLPSFPFDLTGTLICLYFQFRNCVLLTCGGTEL
jgi:hypothetical protein